MTSGGKQVQKAKKYVDYAATGAKKLADWSAAAQKMQKAGKDLNEIEQVVSKLVFVAKISAALQVISVGLAVVQAFLPVKSKEDLILDAVQKVSDQITGLKSDMQSLFKELTSTVWDATGASNLEDKLADIVTAYGYLNSISEKKSRKEDYSLDEDALNGFDVTLLKKAVVEIERYMTGTATAPNLLKLTYEHTFGDPSKVVPLAGYLAHHAEMAVTAHGAVLAIQHRRAAAAKDQTWTEDDAADLADDLAGDETISTDYAAQIKNISHQAHEWSRKCIDSKTRHDNIDRYIDRYLDNLFVPSADDYSGTAERFVYFLQLYWPWLNFTAFAYEGISGVNHHAWIYKGPPHRYHVIKRHVDANKKKMNIIVYFAPRTKPKPAKPMDIDAAVASQSAPRRFAIDQLFKIVNASKRFALTRWHEVNVDDLRDYAPDYGVFAHPTSSDHWHGDLLWMGYNGGSQDLIDDPQDKFFGLASNNPAVLKRSVTTWGAGGDYYCLVIFDDAH